MNHVVFTDFDGTVTTKDTLDMIYDRFAFKNWRELYHQWFREGQRSRQLIKKLLRECHATEEQFIEILRDIPLRDGFLEFRNFCRKHDYELIIVSEGIDLSVKTILHERGIEDIPYYGNTLARDEHGRWTTTHPHGHPECENCGNCKVWHLIERKKRGDAVVYIGDGVTDWCPANVADCVFARKSLADYGARAGVPLHPFRDCHDIITVFKSPGFVARIEHDAQFHLDRKVHLPTRHPKTRDQLYAHPLKTGDT